MVTTQGVVRHDRNIMIVIIRPAPTPGPSRCSYRMIDYRRVIPLQQQYSYRVIIVIIAALVTTSTLPKGMTATNNSNYQQQHNPPM